MNHVTINKYTSGGGKRHPHTEPPFCCVLLVYLLEPNKGG